MVFNAFTLRRSANGVKVSSRPPSIARSSKVRRREVAKRQAKEHARKKANKQRQRLNRRLRRAMIQLRRMVLAEFHLHFVNVVGPARHAKRADVRCQVEACTAMTAEDSRARAVMATSAMSTEAEAMSAEDVRSEAIRSSIKEPLPKAMAEVIAQEEDAPEEAMITEKAEALPTMGKMASLHPLMLTLAIEHRSLTARQSPPTASLQLWRRKVQGVDFDACDVSIHLSKLRGISLSLGVAPLWDGGVSRAGEEFSVVCGFSAALGPLLLERSLDKVFGRKIFKSVQCLPQIHVMYMMQKYWESEVAYFDATERFFRLAENPNTGNISKEELRPFILAMAARHPDLSSLSPDELWQYANTVLAIVFYKHSHCGVIRWTDLSRSAFVASFNSVGRQEEPLEDSEYFSLKRHETLHTDFWSLCGTGWGVDCDALWKYSHGSGGGLRIGPIRAKRVIDARRRSVTSPRGGYGETMDYDAFVGFFVCEVGLRAGTCSESDVRYCFDIVDDRGEGTLDMAGLKELYVDMICEWAYIGEEDYEFRPIEQVVSQHLDGMGIEPGRTDVTLADLLKPDNVQRAGRFFEEIFTGMDLEVEEIFKGADDVLDEYPTESLATTQQEPSYLQAPVEVGPPASMVYGDHYNSFRIPLLSLDSAALWPETANSMSPVVFMSEAAARVVYGNTGVSYPAPLFLAPPQPCFPAVNDYNHQAWLQSAAHCDAGVTSVSVPSYMLGYDHKCGRWYCGP